MDELIFSPALLSQILWSGVLVLGLDLAVPTGDGPLCTPWLTKEITEEHQQIYCLPV